MEQKTQSDFLNRMLVNLSNTEDKSPNAFSYDILSAVAIVAEDLQRIIWELFLKFDVENLEGEELEKRVFQIGGLERKVPTQSKGWITVTGEPGRIIPEGAVFLAGDLEFVGQKTCEIPPEGVVQVPVQSTIYGGDSNVIPHSITKMRDRIDGITDIDNPEEIINGYDAESDDDLRERYYDKLLNPPKGGNPAHYKLWATEVDGIWDAKVFRTWNGGGTVKVVVVGLDRRTVATETLTKVRDHIFKEAPIRYESLTVESATARDIDISVAIKRQNGYDLESLRETIQEKIEDYFYRITFKQDFVSYAKVGGVILEVPGVSDYQDLTLNLGMTNVALDPVEIPVLQNLEVTELE